MPQYKGHIAGGFLAWILVGLITFSYAATPAIAAMWLLWAQIGALFPDIDIKSKGQKLFYFALIPLYIFLVMKGYLIACGVVAFGALVPLIVSHRGLMHCWWFLFIMSSSVAFTLISYKPAMKSQILFSLLFFAAGAFSHLLLDFGPKKMFRGI